MSAIIDRVILHLFSLASDSLRTTHALIEEENKGEQ